MCNHNRGLWGYSGTAEADGAPLTIQSTGMGGPSAAIVLEELADLGVRRAVRIGTCGALDAALRHGDLVAVVTSSAPTARAAPSARRERQTLDAGLTAALAGTRARARRSSVTADLFYDPDPGRQAAWVAAAGARAVEMEAAALAAVAARRGVRFGCLLAVTDLLVGDRERIGADELAAAGLALGEAGGRALTHLGRASRTSPTPVPPMVA